MTEFRPDCTINLFLQNSAEKRGGAARFAWGCSIVHPKHGRLVLAERKMENVSREEAELTCLLFGLRQGARFLQEKVEVTANFPLAALLPKANSSSRGRAGAVKSKEELSAREVLRLEVAKAWEQFRLKRTARMPDAEFELLRETAERAAR